MKKGLKILLIIIVASAFLFLICKILGKDQNKFTVEGNIVEATNKTMYFERVGTNINILDSVILNETGKFKFRQPSSVEPEFYRLRLDGQLINIAIDSTETIIIQSSAANFAQGYAVKGSSECVKIKELAMMQLDASIEYNRLRKEYNDKRITVDEYIEQISPVLDKYKENAKKYIYNNPRSMSAYFALFQRINSMLIFDPYDKEDYKALGAVATAWNQFYPDAIRSKQMYTMAIQALKSIRGERPVEYDVTENSTYFEIKLPNVEDKEVSLFESCKNKVTLIDFTAYQMQGSPEHNIILNTCYEKHKSNGFEIFQLSLDSDEHFWKNSAINLPWICVYDKESVYSRIALNYNVKSLPTGFLLNRNGDIVKRIESFDDLEKEVRELLK
jgi:glutathione peroxidase-family protein